MALRTKFQLLTAKIEVTPGVDPTPAASTDSVACENIQVTGNPNIINTNEYIGSIDSLAPIVGGMPFQVSFDVPLKGSGTPGTAPEWGKLLRACGMAETVTAAAIGVSAQAATAGTANTATGGANFAATAQLYRGMPMALAVNPASALTLITDYTVGKVFTFPETFSPVLDTSTTLQIPINVLYGPASGSIPSITFWLYRDGKLLKLNGARGGWRMSIDAGGIGRLSFTFLCQFGSETDAAMATGVFQNTRPPAWKSGKMLMNRNRVALQNFSLDSGISPVQPENPNATEGFDVAEITSRNITGSINPLERLVAADDVMTDFRAGNQRTMAVQLGATAGNRLGVSIPSALYTGNNPQDRQGLVALNIPFAATGPDAGAFICQY